MIALLGYGAVVLSITIGAGAVVPSCDEPAADAAPVAVGDVHGVVFTGEFSRLFVERCSKSDEFDTWEPALSDIARFEKGIAALSKDPAYDGDPPWSEFFRHYAGFARNNTRFLCVWLQYVNDEVEAIRKAEATEDFTFDWCEAYFTPRFCFDCLQYVVVYDLGAERYEIDRR